MKFLRPFAARTRSLAAFTLVEMLTVVGIIALLVALVTPALVDVIRSTRLNSSGDSLLNRISLAQQSAISLSTEAEIRFYKYINSDSDYPGQPLFYAYQVVQVPNNRPIKALSGVYYFDSGIILTSRQEHSELLKTTATQKEMTPSQYLFVPPTGGSGSDVQYAAMRFYPDGSCRILDSEAQGNTAKDAAFAFTVPPLNKSFMTLIESRSLDAAGVPTNFYCIQIDAYTGKTRVYRP